MKIKILNLLIVIQVMSLQTVSAQNGLTVHNMPPGYTYSQSQQKNCIAIDASNNVYVGFTNIGLGKFMPSTSTWFMFDTLNSGIPANNIKSIAFDGNGDLWAGTIRGLAKYDGVNWTVYNKQNSGLISDTVQCLQAVSGGMWIGTPKGLNFYNGSWTSYTSLNSGIISNNIKCLEIENNNTILVGTILGLSKYDGANWLNFSTSSIKQIKYISPQATWLLTTAGIRKITNGVLQNTGACNYNSVSPYLTSKVVIEKNNNKLYTYVTEYGGSFLVRIDEDDYTEVIYVDPRSHGSFTPGYYTLNYFSFDNNGVLWTAYAQDTSNLGGLSSFDETQSSGFILQPNVCSSSKYIDINNVAALINNRGDMFWDLVSNPKYEVPKCSGKHAIFSAALWIGGYDANGNLHTSAQTYRQGPTNDYLPGPLDTITGTTDSMLTIVPYDNIWKIDRNTIDDFKTNFLNGNVTNGTYPVPNELLTYPAIGTGNITRNLSPYVDFNSDGNYNPYDGDYPLIKGDQQLYWIFNDMDTNHTVTQGIPFGFEIRGYAYGYTCNQFILGDSNAVLDYTTFYKYEITNRSTNTYDSVFVGQFTDSDLGNYNDDYIGCDSALNAGFTYNGDNDDEILAGGYGINPPMINCQILKGPEPVLNDGIDNNHVGVIDEAGEVNMMTVFTYFDGGFGNTSNPEAADDFFQFLTARWKDGSYLTNDGLHGENQGFPSTHYAFSGIPYDTGWTESSAGNVTSDRRFIVSSGPFTIAPGETRTIDFAYVFTWDSTAANGLTTSIARNTADLQRVKYWFDANNFPSCLNTGVENVSSVISEIKIFPNPTTDFLNVTCNSSSKQMRLEIYDVTGRKVLEQKINPTGRINVSRLSPSVYFVRVNVDGNVITKKFVKQ